MGPFKLFNSQISCNNLILNKVFNNYEIEIIQENKEHNKKEFYFKSTDIGSILGIAKIRNTLKDFDEDENIIENYYENIEYLKKFISTIKKAGSKTFIIHARRAILNKLTPKQNLSIPPLKYNFVYNLKKDFKNDTVILNGGIDSIDKIKTHLEKVDGVMIGRAAYHSPYFLVDVEREIFDNGNVLTRAEIMEQMIPYIKEETKNGTRLNQIMRHTIGLFHGQKGSSYWKRYLSKNMCIREADLQKVNHIMDHINNNNIITSLGR